MTMKSESSTAERHELLIQDAHILSVDPAIGVLERGSILIRDGKIVEVGADLPASSSTEVIDARGFIAIPGIVDTHTHVWNGIWRTLAGRSGSWSNYGNLGTGMGPRFTPQDSYQAVLFGMLELLDSGITTVHNWAHNMVSPEHADAEIQATINTGIRSHFSYGYHWSLPRDKPMNIGDAGRLRDQWHRERLTFGVALRNDTTPDPTFTHFPELSIPPEVMAEEILQARSLGLPFTMHVLNEGPAQYYIDQGYAKEDCLIVHGYQWDAAEWKALAKAGAAISFSPHSALLGKKVLVPIGDAVNAGMRVGLSFDHMNRSGNADMFRLMQIVAINEALRIGETPSAESLIRMATLGGAEALGLEKEIGSLTPGKQADVVLLDAAKFGLAPLHDASWAVANSASPQHVDTVIVAGEIVKRDGVLRNWDAREVSEKTLQTLRGLLSRMGH